MIIENKISYDEAIPFVINILKLYAFGISEKDQHDIALVFSQYFLDNSNYVITYNDDNKPIGLIAASVKNSQAYQGLDENKLLALRVKTNNKVVQDFIDLSIRVTQSISENHINGYEAELIAFSSLSKGKGIGSKLIHTFEDHLRNVGLGKYFLFTDENCDFHWYEHHNYHLVNKFFIKTDDLTHLFKEPVEYYAYIFDKNI